MQPASILRTCGRGLFPHSHRQCQPVLVVPRHARLAARHGWVSAPDQRRSLQQLAAIGQAIQESQRTSPELDDCLEMFQPSPHLRELINAQLHFIFTTGAFQGGLVGARATVYARCSALLPGPDLQLQRVAAWPPRAARPAWMSSSSLTGGSHGITNSMEEDDILLLASSAWTAGEEVGGTASAEASLLGEEVLLLPNSATLVLPLSSQGVLVGLLVVEGTQPTALARLPAQPPLGTSSEAEHTTPATQMPPFAADDGGWSNGSSSSAGSSSSSNSTDTPGGGSTTPLAAAACVGLTEQQLDVLRSAAPMLAAAAALDMRSALVGAAAAASARKAASLLSEARGPLRAISTFGRMLVPRLEEGAPDRDMAAGIMTQELRLQEVLGALEAALRPASSSSSWAGSAMQAGAAWEDSLAGQPPQQQQLQQQLWGGGDWLEPWGSGVSSLPGLGAPAALEGFGLGPDALSSSPPLLLSEQQQQQPAAGAVPVVGDDRQSAQDSPGTLVLPDDTSHGPAAGGRTTAAVAMDASRPAAAAAPDAVWGPELPGALRASARDIRWAASKRPGARSAAGPRAAAAAAVPTAAVTLDVTGSSAAPDTVVGPGPGAAAGGSRVHHLDHHHQQQQQVGLGAAEDRLLPTEDRPLPAAGGGVPACEAISQDSCNLVEVVQHVLRAASKLAAVTGVHFIVNHPLQAPDLDQHHHHHRHQHTAQDQQQQHQGVGAQPIDSASTTSATSSTSSEEEEVQPPAPSSATTSLATPPQPQGDLDAPPQVPPLLPRPIPPLHVAARPQVVQRSLGYVLDVALQCTPSGGQLLVTARQCSGGVALCVLHSGQLHPRRLHPSSRVMAAALPPAGRPRRTAKTDPTASATAGDSSNSSSKAGGSRGTALGGRVDGLVSLDFARQLLQTVGGRISVVFPHHFMNAQSGQLEVGTSVEVWLPRPRAAAAQ